MIAVATKYAAGLAAATSSAVLSDQFMVDTMVAFLGGFIAMAAAETLKSKVWEGMVGIAAGLGVALWLRSGEFSDIIVRGIIFVVAVFGTKTTETIRNTNILESFFKAVIVPKK
jgi:hypothetical protein